LASIAATKLPGKKLFQKVDEEILEKRKAAVKQIVKALVTNSTSLAKSVELFLVNGLITKRAFGSIATSVEAF